MCPRPCGQLETQLTQAKLVGDSFKRKTIELGEMLILAKTNPRELVQRSELVKLQDMVYVAPTRPPPAEPPGPKRTTRASTDGAGP